MSTAGFLRSSSPCALSRPLPLPCLPLAVALSSKFPCLPWGCPFQPDPRASTLGPALQQCLELGIGTLLIRHQKAFYKSHTSKPHVCSGASSNLVRVREHLSSTALHPPVYRCTPCPHGKLELTLVSLWAINCSLIIVCAHRKAQGLAWPQAACGRQGLTRGG